MSNSAQSRQKHPAMEGVFVFVRTTANMQSAGIAIAIAARQRAVDAREAMNGG